MMYLRGKLGSLAQMINTFNLFNVHSGSENGEFSNLVPPLLHIKLSIGNKLVSFFDLIVKDWAVDDANHQLCREHLLSVYRNEYYSSMISGSQWDNVFYNMETLCNILFHMPIGGNEKYYLPSTMCCYTWRNFY